MTPTCGLRWDWPLTKLKHDAYPVFRFNTHLKGGINLLSRRCGFVELHLGGFLSASPRRPLCRHSPRFHKKISRKISGLTLRVFILNGNEG